MSISQKVYDTLKSEYESGMTQEEVAARHHVRHSQVQPILSGKRSTGGLLLSTLDRMFPNATIDLYGDNVSIRADHNKGSVVGVNHGSIAADFLSSVMDKILAADELTDEEKVKVLRVLKKG